MYVLKNWKTTAAGIVAAVAQIVAYGAHGKWAAIAIAVLGLFASDAGTAVQK